MQANRLQSKRWLPGCRLLVYAPQCNQIAPLSVSQNHSTGRHRKFPGSWKLWNACQYDTPKLVYFTTSMEYYYKQRNHDYKTLPAFKTGCVDDEGIKQMELIYPGPGAKIYVPLEINGEKGRTVFSATHREQHAKIFWSLDNNFITSTETRHQIAISPAAGKHVITLTDNNGNSISRNFEIIDKE